MMLLLRTLKWVGGFVFLTILIAVALLALFGWNWLREPLMQLTLERTGRRLTIGGDLQLRADWPLLHLRATDVKFGNPPWAGQQHMLTADSVELALNLSALFRQRLAFDVLALHQARVFLETDATGRKNWLLDRDQKDESAHLPIGHLALDESRITYDEPAHKTHLVADVATREAAADNDGASEGKNDGKSDEKPAVAAVIFDVRGLYRGLPLVARGSGGPLLALRDGQRPYPFSIEATIGRTSVRAAGSATNLSRLTALDARLTLRGDSLAQLYPLLGIALPETHAYQSTGRLLHDPGMWRYQDFTARMGDSDLSGTLQVDTGKGDKGSKESKDHERPFLHGDLLFGKLVFTDLGPVVGTRPSPATQGSAPQQRRLLPDVPFHAERWNKVDADIKLSARTIVRAEQLPIDQLVTRLRMRDAVLSLDPLEFGVAGGTLGGVVTLDGQHDPIQTHARLAATGIVFEKLFPNFKRSEAKLGRVAGQLDLAGSGNSVAQMLASASGSVELVVAGGEMSKLAMEMAGLHVLEIVALKIAGDRRIKIRCGIADFRAQNGVMQIGQLLLDTEISRIDGSGRIDFASEMLDLTLVPQSKKASLIALHSPIYVRGSFAQPVVDVDKGRIAARSLGALALGVVNPLLALLPLVEAGPGLDSDCGQLIGKVRLPAAEKSKVKARTQAQAN